MNAKNTTSYRNIERQNRFRILSDEDEEQMEEDDTEPNNTPLRRPNKRPLPLVLHGKESNNK